MKFFIRIRLFLFLNLHNYRPLIRICIISYNRSSHLNLDNYRTISPLIMISITIVQSVPRVANRPRMGRTVPEFWALSQSCQPSRNFGPYPGDIGDVPDLHAPCASFRRLPLAYGISSDLKRAVSLLNCSVCARRLPIVT